MSIPNLSLEGKTALVTGSRRGLGRALTERVRERMDPETRKKAEKSYPLRRLAGVEEVLAPVLFLVSEASSYITGHTLVMDGGLLA
ncbi:MAG: SDR family oxidoreductase [Deltaproteobacteria bacterium]|nr:SDR family oxidoreductase [Deltaproteobacteria bacterium]